MKNLTITVTLTFLFIMSSCATKKSYDSYSFKHTEKVIDENGSGKKELCKIFVLSFPTH